MDFASLILKAAGAIATAVLLAAVPLPASGQSPEMQDLLNQINGEFRRTQGERLSQNCDYTAIDIAKQALQRAGFTNMAAGPVVIGALESACKGALSLVGLGLAADAYSMAKCVYDYYTTAMDARALVTCLKVEAGGFAAGKLVDWIGVDAATGALTGRVIDRIGDDLKAGGLDEATARLKEGEIRAFAERMAEALTQVQRQAREKAENESPEPIVYTGFAYGCTVTIISRFAKHKPPTQGPNSVTMQIAIRDCECYARAPTVGKAMKEASIFVTVPVTFTPGPGRAPSWTADLGRMRTRIRSVCCDGTTSGVHPPGGEEGGATGTGTGTTGGTGTTTTQPDPPPPPPPPPKPPPTLAERCPECAPIINDIANDQYDIEAAQGRIDRADEELRTLRNERADQDDEIARAQRIIQMSRNRISLPSGGSPGGTQLTTTLTADGVKVTTITHADGRVETRSERTGNRDIDSARDRIAAARKKLEDIDRREAAARERRAAAVRDKANAEAKLRADQARLEQCEEECRKRISQPPPPPVLVVPGTPTQPAQPPAADPLKPPEQPTTPGKPPAPPPTVFDAPMPPPPPITIPAAKCDACKPAWRAAYNAADAVGSAEALIKYYQMLLDTVDAADAGRPSPYPRISVTSYLASSSAERARLRGQINQSHQEAVAKLFAARDELDRALAALEACNRTCGGGVTIGTVIGVTGTNPFNPDNPTGTPTGGTPQPPPPPPPPGARGTLQFSSATYGGTEGQTVTVVVTRAAGATGAASIQYVASTRTATAGSDFAAAQGTLTWADGDMTAKTFTVTLIDDTVVEDTELFDLTLLNPTGATMGEPSRATMSIADNDSAPPPQTGSLQFSAPTYAATEGQGGLQVTVTRTGGSANAVTVQYATAPGSATAGSDFQPASGTLSWAAGDTSSKTFSIAIVDDTTFESAESFTVTLSNPTGGATLGSPSTATVNIADNDTQGACGPSGSQWQTAAGRYACSGNCDPCPTPQQVTVNDNRVTISPFHAGGAATFTGCAAQITSDSNTLTYFNQANHRATVTRSGNTFMANVQSSGGGSCVMSCLRTGP